MYKKYGVGFSQDYRSVPPARTGIQTDCPACRDVERNGVASTTTHFSTKADMGKFPSRSCSLMLVECNGPGTIDSGLVVGKGSFRPCPFGTLYLANLARSAHRTFRLGCRDVPKTQHTRYADVQHHFGVVCCSHTPRWVVTGEHVYFVALQIYVFCTTGACFLFFQRCLTTLLVLALTVAGGNGTSERNDRNHQVSRILIGQCLQSRAQEQHMHILLAWPLLLLLPHTAHTPSQWRVTYVMTESTIEPPISSLSMLAPEITQLHPKTFYAHRLSCSRFHHSN